MNNFPHFKHMCSLIPFQAPEDLMRFLVFIVVVSFFLFFFKACVLILFHCQPEQILLFVCSSCGIQWTENQLGLRNN